MDSFREFEHAGWQRAAQSYNEGFGSLTTQAVEPLLDAVSAGPGRRILDVACGPGFAATAAARRGAVVLGIDFSSEMVELARRRNPELTFEQGDAERLAIDDQSFDAVVMNFGMLHLGRPELAISEAFRVLKPGGRYSFTVWDLPERARGFEIVLQAIQKHGDLNAPLPAGPPFFRFSAPDESQRTLATAGFGDISSAQVPLTWTLQSGEALYSTMRKASVRTAALLNLQTPESLEAILLEISNNAERFRTARGLELPMPAVLTSARRPA